MLGGRWRFPLLGITCRLVSCSQLETNPPSFSNERYSSGTNWICRQETELCSLPATHRIGIWLARPFIDWKKTTTPTLLCLHSSLGDPVHSPRRVFEHLAGIDLLLDSLGQQSTSNSWTSVFTKTSSTSGHSWFDSSWSVPTLVQSRNQNSFISWLSIPEGKLVISFLAVQVWFIREDVTTDPRLQFWNVHSPQKVFDKTS